MTWFDIIVIVVTLLSAVMSLGRGLVREAFSVIAFAIGALIGVLAVVFLESPLKQIMSPKEASIWPAVILFLVGFLASYVVAAFLGGRLSKLIHSSPEIGVLDRIAGAGFGVLRGLLAAIFSLLLIEQVLPDNAIPADIVKARSYPYFHAATSWVRSTIPGFIKGATDVIKKSTPERPDN